MENESAGRLLELVLSTPSIAQPPEKKPSESPAADQATDWGQSAGNGVLPPVVVGMLVDLGSSGEPLVDFPGNAAGVPVLARSTVAIGSSAVGREVVLVFGSNDLRNPIVMGIVRQQGDPGCGRKENGQSETRNEFEIEVDGERVLVAAKRDIVFRCGKASITLTRAGKILLRGAYILSRSSGVNSIKGGSVQVN